MLTWNQPPQSLQRRLPPAQPTTFRNNNLADNEDDKTSTSQIRSEIKELNAVLMDTSKLQCHILNHHHSNKHQGNLPGTSDRREDVKDR